MSSPLQPPHLDAADLTPREIPVLDTEGAVRRARDLGQDGQRVVIGLTGPPGSGKSTLADRLIVALGGDGHAVLVPMDGFHLAQCELDRLGIHEQKGAPGTFDASGYVALLKRLHSGNDQVVYAPAFDRRLEEPIAGAIPIPAAVPIIITEGNYLLLSEAPWSEVRDLVSEVWYCDVDTALRTRRLAARHREFGRSADEARAWVDRVDEANTAVVALTRARADIAIAV